MRTDYITPLLDEAKLPAMGAAMDGDYPRAISREKAEAIINAAVSLHQCPAGGTAAGFAMLDLMVGALGLSEWKVKDAHNAHPGGGETGTPSPVSQDVV